MEFPDWVVKNENTIAVAPLLGDMSEEQEKLYGIQFSSVQLPMFVYMS